MAKMGQPMLPMSNSPQPMDNEDAYLRQQQQLLAGTQPAYQQAAAAPEYLATNQSGFIDPNMAAANILLQQQQQQLQQLQQQQQQQQMQQQLQQMAMQNQMLQAGQLGAAGMAASSNCCFTFHIFA